MTESGWLGLRPSLPDTITLACLGPFPTDASRRWSKLPCMPKELPFLVTRDYVDSGSRGGMVRLGMDFGRGPGSLSCLDPESLPFGVNSCPRPSVSLRSFCPLVKYLLRGAGLWNISFSDICIIGLLWL